MKTIFTAFAAALLIAGLFFSPVAAASSASPLASSTCGDTYVVQPLDWLSRIAVKCNVTVAEILALNPQIVNANLIYTGQVLRLTGNASTTPYTPYGPSTTGSGSARVSLSNTWAYPGQSISVYISGFPANAEVDYRVGVYDEAFSLVYDGTVLSNGTDSQVITIPTSAAYGEYWVVQVVTTSLANITSVTSRSIYIGSISPYTWPSSYPKVSISATQAHVGDTISVYASGFPAYAEIDFRVGVSGQNFSVVYDGTVTANGTASQVITIPAGANAGEYWIVQVVTTSLANITSIYSHTIYILG